MARSVDGSAHSVVAILVRMGNSSEASEFDLRQYGELKDEVIRMVQETRTVERQVLVGVWAIWTLSGAIERAQPLVWLAVPLIVAAAARCAALYASIGPCAEYMREIEKRAPRADGLDGWEHYLARYRDEAWRKKLGATSAFYWGLLLIAALVVARQASH